MECEFLAKKFDRFGWERERNTPSQDRQMLDFMDALQDFPLVEVQAACKAAVLSNPNKMPNEGHVRAEIMKARAALPKPTLMPEPEEERIPATDEQRAAILAEFGMSRERLGAVTSQKVRAHHQPKGPTEDEVRAFAEDVAEQTLPEAARATAVEEAVQASKAGCV